MPAETTPTTPRDSLREPESKPLRLTAEQIVPMLRSVTASGERLNEADFGDIQHALDASREQAATEARRELLAKVEEGPDPSCPICWHVHMTYNDEACVSCGCDPTGAQLIAAVRSLMAGSR